MQNSSVREPRMISDEEQVWNYTSLVYILAKVDEIKKQYPSATDFSMEAQTGAFGGGLALALTYRREQTEAEILREEKANEVLERDRMQKEKAQYLLLKAKFEGK